MHADRAWSVCAIASRLVPRIREARQVAVDLKYPIHAPLRDQRSSAIGYKTGRSAAVRWAGRPVPRPPVQIGNPKRDLVHRAPSGKLDTASRIGRSSGHLHDEPDDLLVEPPVPRIVEPSGHSGRQSRLQTVPRQPFLQISIAPGGVPPRLPGGQVHRNNRQRNQREQMPVRLQGTVPLPAGGGRIAPPRRRQSPGRRQDPPPPERQPRGPAAVRQCRFWQAGWRYARLFAGIGHPASRRPEACSGLGSASQPRTILPRCSSPGISSHSDHVIAVIPLAPGRAFGPLPRRLRPPLPHSR